MSETTLRLIDCNGYTPDENRAALDSLRHAIATVKMTLALFEEEVEALEEAMNQ